MRSDPGVYLALDRKLTPNTHPVWVDDPARPFFRLICIFSTLSDHTPFFALHFMDTDSFK